MPRMTSTPSPRPSSAPASASPWSPSRLALTRLPGVAHRDIAGPRLHRELHAVTMSDTSLTPLTEVFLTFLRDAAQEITADWGSPRG